jgi:hypothetical protein
MLDADSGRWVDTYPARRKDLQLSYRLSQLSVPAVSPAYIAARYRQAQGSPRHMARFRCSVLALPQADNLTPLSPADLDSARGSSSTNPATLPSTLPSPNGVVRFAGVDMGDAAHLTVCEEFFGRGEDGEPRHRFIHFEEVDSDGLPRRVEALWEELGLRGLVVDAKPLRVSARNLAYARPDTVWLQDFGPSGCGVKPLRGEHRGKHFQRVLVDREESLGELVDGLLTGKVLLPPKDAASPPVLDVVDRHLLSLRREKVIDARGNTVVRFARGGSDHFACAMNSALVAARLAGTTGFTVETTGTRRSFSPGARFTRREDT